MVKIEISDKVSSYATNLLVKRGYYPAKVVSIDTYKDKEKKIVNKVLKDGTIGRSLIVKFAIYTQDANGKPVSPLIYTYKAEGGATLSEEVVLASFVYYEYEKNGVKNSALTAKSNAGKLFTALGYDFTSKEALDTEKFIGKWAEVNIDNYEKTEQDGTLIKKSVIKDVSKYAGPAMEEVKSSSKPEEMTEDDIDVIDA